MNRIKLNAELRKLLGNLTEPLELCDETGRVIGRILPEIDLSGWDLTEPADSEEELQRREQETESCSTAELLSRLEKL